MMKLALGQVWYTFFLGWGGGKIILGDEKRIHGLKSLKLYSPQQLLCDISSFHCVLHLPSYVS